LTKARLQGFKGRSGQNYKRGSINGEGGQRKSSISLMFLIGREQRKNIRGKEEEVKRRLTREKEERKGVIIWKGGLD